MQTSKQTTKQTINNKQNPNNKPNPSSKQTQNSKCIWSKNAQKSGNGRKNTLHGIDKYIMEDTIIDSIIDRKNKLEEIMEMLNSRIEMAPGGNLRICKKNKNWQYYMCDTPGDTLGKYIKKSEMLYIRALAQNSYDKKMLKELQQELNVIERFLNSYYPENIKKIYFELQEQRRELVEPVHYQEDDYCIKWLREDYYHMKFEDDYPEYYTDNGERVRSKSEIIIANKMYASNVPYRYEYPIELGNIIVHPDFYCLNRRTGKEYVWEHFGMMDNVEYVNVFIRKVESYCRHGYILGDNLIVSFETGDYPLNVKMIDEFIDKYLM